MADKELEELEQEALAELDDGSEEQEAQEPEVVDEEPEPEGEPDGGDEVNVGDVDDSSDDSGNSDPISDEEVQEPDVAEQPAADDNTENELGFKLKKPVKIKSRGMEIDITSEKDLIELAHKGFDYFKKTQELAKWRKDIGVIEDAELSIQELQLLADVKKGDKAAIATLMSTYGYDPLEIEPEHGAEYKPTPIPDVNYEVEAIVEQIKSEPEHAQHFQKIATAVPDDFLNEVGSDPVKLMHFNDHIKRGLADKIVPEALKAQAIYGGNFMDHYTRIGQQLAMQDPNMQVPTAQPNPAQVTPQQEPQQQKPLSDRERELRRKATTPSRGSRKVSFKADAESIWDLPEEEFLKLSAKDLK
jgi:hypothetical protein